MPLSPLAKVRYPTQDDGPYGGEQLQAAVLDVEPYLVPRFVDALSRDAAFAAYVQAGGVLEDGMQAFTRDDGRLWRRNSAEPTGWAYAGGNPPPIVAIPPLAGWTTPATSRKAYAYKDGAGLVHLAGWLSNTAAYTPSANQYAGTLPVGYRPASDQVFDVPLTGARCTVTVLTDGRIRTDVLLAPATTAGAGANWWLYGLSFHPTADSSLV